MKAPMISKLMKFESSDVYVQVFKKAQEIWKYYWFKSSGNLKAQKFQKFQEFDKLKKFECTINVKVSELWKTKICKKN